MRVIIIDYKIELQNIFYSKKFVCDVKNSMKSSRNSYHFCKDCLSTRVTDHVRGFHGA